MRLKKFVLIVIPILIFWNIPYSQEHNNCKRIEKCRKNVKKYKDSIFIVIDPGHGCVKKGYDHYLFTDKYGYFYLPAYG